MDTATPAQLKRIAELEDAYGQATADFVNKEIAGDPDLPGAERKMSNAYSALNQYLRSVYPG